MDKPIEALLDKVAPDRRRFVQSILGMAGYTVPVVRSFMMASAAIVPALSIPSITTTVTTAPPTTTRNPWRPTPHALAVPDATTHPLLKTNAVKVGMKKI
jgi:hypothetical protein